MRKSAMQDIHNMNQRALNSYAEHQLNSLKSQFGIGQGSTNKKPQQLTNTSNEKASSSSSLSSLDKSLWDQLNEGKSKQESGNFESSNITFVKRCEQPVQPQNVQQQLENALKQLEEMQATNNQLQTSFNQVQTQNMDLQTRNMDLQTRLLAKAEEASDNQMKYMTEKAKVDVVKVKLGNFIDHHDGIDDQDQLVDILGDLQVDDN